MFTSNECVRDFRTCRVAVFSSGIFGISNIGFDGPAKVATVAITAPGNLGKCLVGWLSGLAVSFFGLKSKLVVDY